MDTETKPLLNTAPSAPVDPQHSVSIPSQQLVIQPVEFNVRHKNIYGYLGLVVAILLIINYLLIDHRTCKIGRDLDFDLLQRFHLAVLILALILFVVSYFDYATVIHDFKLFFYFSLFLMFIATVSLAYTSIEMLVSPCKPLGSGLLKIFSSKILDDKNNVFSAKDSTGITVFLFGILLYLLLVLFHKVSQLVEREAQPTSKL